MFMLSNITPIKLKINVLIKMPPVAINVGFKRWCEYPKLLSNAKNNKYKQN